ncbi:MAG: ATP-binding protein, partial [Acidobacteriota bacterium]|nr:ATP-binding protein [Acidobacteriota bacterium]
HATLDSNGGAAHLNIEISDTGSGIAPDALPKIFERFYTTRTTGTGLGLAIVRQTIHDHGGQITARSEPGQGTRFVIKLPLDSKRQSHVNIRVP